VAAKSCAFTLALGKRHFRYAPSSYKVCITPTQAAVLFGSDRKPEPLGCGVFACAFPHSDPDKIVKITRDPSDVAGLVQGQGLQVPKLYSSHRLTSAAYWTNPRRRTESYQVWPDRPEGAFALVLERLRPLTGIEKATWNKRIRRMQSFMLAQARKANAAAAHPPTTPAKPGAPAEGYKVPTIGEMAEAVCPKHAGKETERCQLRVRELNQISTALRARGIDWADMHAGNIGVDAKGRWKALDLGATDTPLETDLPELSGARRR
jgi:hypothetical protein